MQTRKDKQQDLKDQIRTELKNRAEHHSPTDQEGSILKKEPDTAPDQFIGPNADTDLPIDRQVINDSVLRGEYLTG